MNEFQLDKYEKSIEEHADDFVEVSTNTKRRVKKIITKANEINRITLRLNKQDLELIKTKARKEGISYQILISSILHKYATDKLVDEKQFLKSVKMNK